MQRTALAAAGLVLALGAGCTRDTSFDITATFGPFATTGATIPSDTVQTVDLAQMAGSSWSHRDKLKSVKVTHVLATARDVTAAAGTTGTGSALIGPVGSPTTPVGTWTDVPIAEGSWIDAGGSDALNAVVDGALNGDGKLDVRLQGVATADFTTTVEVILSVDVEYSISPF